VQVHKEACQMQQNGTTLCRFQVVANGNVRAVTNETTTLFAKTANCWQSVV
jgi:hypothetical protein